MRTMNPYRSPAGAPQAQTVFQRAKAPTQRRWCADFSPLEGAVVAVLMLGAIVVGSGAF